MEFDFGIQLALGQDRHKDFYFEIGMKQWVSHKDRFSWPCAVYAAFVCSSILFFLKGHHKHLQKP